MSFNPAEHLVNLKGKEYLEVKWRLVWFRDDHPHGMIATELVNMDERVAVFKATVQDSEGGLATGFGSETPGDFRDYIEKAETKAIGRALGALGYGTQFTEDFDTPTRADGTPSLADAPVQRAPQRQSEPQDRPVSTEQPATEKQLQFLRSVARAAGLDEAGLREEIRKATGGERMELTRREASAMLDRLKQTDPRTPAQPVHAPPRPAAIASGPPITEQQGKALHAIAGKKWGSANAHANLTTVVKKQYNVESVNDLTKQQASQLIGAFEKNPGAIDILLAAEDYSDTPELQDKDRIA